jgi:uncharacterized protein YegL
MNSKASKAVMSASQGMTLIEVALILLLGTLMFIPIINTLGSKTAGGSGTGMSATSSNAQHTREIVAANNIMDRALGGEIMSKNVAALSDLVATGGNTFNLAAVPTNGTPVTFPAANGATYTYGDEDQGVRMQYRWRMQDVSYDSAGVRLTPEGNRVLRATLDVYPVGAATTDPPSYTFSTYLYSSENYTPPGDPRVGLALILDTSGSMQEAPNADNAPVNAITTPFLKDRFHREDALPAGTTLSTADLNLYDDRKLDITWSQPTDNVETQFNETFLKQAVLGLPTCDLSSNTTSTALKNWFYTINNVTSQKQPLLNICGDFSALTSTQWKNQVNGNITRIEAARNALLGFTVAIENDTDLTKNLDLGFVTFENSAKLEAPLESAQLINDPANSNIGKLRFKNNRDRMSWINRYDEKYGTNGNKRTIDAAGGTYTQRGMEAARTALLARTGLAKRIIILLTDGDPNPDSGNNSRTYLANTLAKNYYKNDGIQIYTIGFAGLSAGGETMLKKMAENSSGQYFYADNGDDLNKIFFTLSYELRKQLLLTRVTRYTPGLGTQLNCDPARSTCY